jgi:hypothetical protein
MSAARADNDGDPTQSGTQTVAIVVSHRLGPTDITVSTPVLVHLVSLHGIDTQSVDLVANREHILMTSLFSWTYTALPPGSPDVVSMLQHLGNKDAGLSVLRTDLTVDPPQKKSFDKLSEPDIAKWITKRQADGYTLTRYRTITGEQTAAIYCGPLTSTRIPYPLHEKVSFQSNFGTDLQILDPDSSLMPLTQTDLESEADLFSLRSDHVYHQMPFQSLYYLNDGTANTPNGGPYNYHNIPNNTDYAVIQEWVLDRLHMAGIPAHYLLPDPSHIPPESLCFFHIDRNWLDAMVDGALSLANHLADVPEEDYTRSSLKATLNRYLTTPLVGDYLQQIPAYGFMLRSQLLVQFPDLAVGAEFALEKDDVHTSEDWAHAKPTAPILVQRKLAPDIMLVLFDREPPKLSSVTFTLPAHQQTFIAAFGLNPEKADLRFKRVYATGADEPLPEPDVKEHPTGRRQPCSPTYGTMS